MGYSAGAMMTPQSAGSEVFYTGSPAPPAIPPRNSSHGHRRGQLPFNYVDEDQAAHATREDEAGDRTA